MPTVYKRAAARFDLVEQYVYLAENVSMDIAERFLINAEFSFSDLLEHPYVGAPIILRNPALSGLRKWQVKEFSESLIFYIPRNIDITVVRVLNAAQDWWNLLGIKK